ncbi:MAG TPA: hypothetical protein VIH90_06535 [Candidatus Saccharimonadales bacterium]
MKNKFDEEEMDLDNALQGAGDLVTEDFRYKVSQLENRVQKIGATYDRSRSRIVIDELGLALLLATVHRQDMVGADWNEQRGDMFIFADTPTVRSCVGLWESSISGNDTMPTIERYLFSMLDYQTHDCFHEIDQILHEKLDGLS